LVGGKHGVERFGYDEGRMGPQEAQMREPRPILLAQTARKLVGKKCGLRLILAVGGRRIGDLADIPDRQMGQCIVAEAQPVLAQPAQPWLVVLGKPQANVEAGQYALVGQQARVAVGDDRRIGGLVGVAEQRRGIAGAARRQGDVVEAGAERRAVAHHAVGHLVEAGVEARAGRRARRGIGVVPEERRALGSECVEVGRPDYRMVGNAQALTPPLVGGDEQDIEHQSPSTRMSLPASVTFTLASCGGGGVRWSLKVSTCTVLPWPSSTLRRITEPRKLTSD